MTRLTQPKLDLPFCPGTMFLPRSINKMNIVPYNHVHNIAGDLLAAVDLDLIRFHN
jgi:hypothetical protein